MTYSDGHADICCRNLLDSNNGRSPFQRIISLGYYDGTTSGVAECAGCSLAYKYDLLAWDEDQDIRIFSFAPLAAGSFSEILEACRVLGEPRWPIWTPIWQFSSESIKNSVDSKIEKILDRAKPVSFILASSDISDHILACKEIATADTKMVQAISSKSPITMSEWLAFLNLS